MNRMLFFAFLLTFVLGVLADFTPEDMANWRSVTAYKSNPTNMKIAPFDSVLTSHIINQCPFEIHVKATIAQVNDTLDYTKDCCDTRKGQVCETGMYIIQPGGDWWNGDYHSYPNNCGQTVKLSREGDPAVPGNIYQVEYVTNSTTDELWYNFSSVDGDSFHDVKRFMQISGTQCAVLYCDANQDWRACDIRDNPNTNYNVRNCPAHTGNDVTVYFC